MNGTAISRIYEENILARVIVNTIPYVGGSLDVALSQKWEEFQQNRINDLLEKIQKEINEIKVCLIDKSILESEEFYDLIYQIVNVAIKTRCPEIRTGCACTVRDAILKKETIADLERQVRQISDLSEKDLLFLGSVKSQFDLGKDVSGNAIAYAMSDYGYSSIECEWYLYRFENLGILNYPRHKIVGQGLMKFTKSIIFDRLVSYLGL